MYAWSVSHVQTFLMVHPVLGSFTGGLEVVYLEETSSRGRWAPSCQVGGHTMPPWPRAEGRQVRRSKGNIVLEYLLDRSGIDVLKGLY